MDKKPKGIIAKSSQSKVFGTTPTKKPRTVDGVKGYVGPSYPDKGGNQEGE